MASPARQPQEWDFLHGNPGFLESDPEGWSESGKASYAQASEVPEYLFHYVLLVKQVTKSQIQGERCSTSSLNEVNNRAFAAVIYKP